MAPNTDYDRVGAVPNLYSLVYLVYNDPRGHLLSSHSERLGKSSTELLV